MTGKKQIILDGLMADNGGQAVTPLDFFFLKKINIYLLFKSKVGLAR